ncbi:hypothetical protein, partial [Paenibacillus popilliae]|uniref:hypothetical protein n=1 Tax=Paenibacillus popilliae TaxID=78057 RepID=UPI0005AA0278
SLVYITKSFNHYFYFFWCENRLKDIRDCGRLVKKASVNHDLAEEKHAGNDNGLRQYQTK